MDKKFELSTQAVRAGQVRTEFNEHAEALFLTSSFVFDNAAQAAARLTQLRDECERRSSALAGGGDAAKRLAGVAGTGAGWDP